MIGIDTNVLVRLLTRDDEEMAARAVAVIEARCSVASPAFLCLITLVETVWVLRSAFHYGREEVADVIVGLLQATLLRVEEESVVAAALVAYRRSRMDFPDLLIAELNRRRGCTATLTFDRKAAHHPAFEAI